MPGEYSRFVMAGVRQKKDLRIMPLFRSWFGASIYQKMNEKYAFCFHRVEKDYELSCLVPWREYECADLVLVQLGIKVELQPVHTFFFCSTLVVHMI